MAANYWMSSHYKQLLDKEDVGHLHPADQDLGLTTEEVKILKISQSMYIKQLGIYLKARQRVVATATYYFRKFYVKKSFAEYDPRLMATTCLYLAAKAEESSVQAKVIVYFVKSKIWTKAEAKPYRFGEKDILEMEMRLLEGLDYYLVVYHPYRPLVHFLNDAGMSGFMVPTWSLLNDMYYTDICLTNPPYMIALASIYLVSSLLKEDISQWFSELKVDTNQVKNIIMEVLDFYDNYRAIPDEVLNAVLAKLPSRT